MNIVPSREELFAMAAEPLGSREMQEIADEAKRCELRSGAKPPREVRDLTKRVSKVWLPAGKKSVVSAEAKEIDAAIRANQIDLEDAIEAAGGERGSSRS